MYLTNPKIDEIRMQIKSIIEKEYRHALDLGLLDSSAIANEIWETLIDKNALHIPAPESAYGCYENPE